jgi:uncharacterized repeat protein (TIGR03803 family)
MSLRKCAPALYAAGFVVLWRALAAPLPAQTYTVLHSFDGLDGDRPIAGLVMDAASNLYGTTSYRGSDNLGVVFKLDPSNHETVLHSFLGPDGARPDAGLIMDTAGNLYGTTSSGGSGRSYAGAVFKLSLQ